MKHVLLLLALVSTLGLSAQNTLKLNINGIKPLGTFGNNLSDASTGGFAIGYGYKSKNAKWSHFEIGMNTGVAMYAYRKYDVTFIPEGQTTPKETEVYEDDCLVQYSAEMKYYVFNNRAIMPYAVGNFGGNTFFSHIDPSDENSGYESKFKWQGTAFQAGIGIGVRISVFQLLSQKPKSNDLVIDFCKTFHAGTRTHYRYFKNDEAPHEDLNYGVHHSFTPYSNFSVGIGWLW